MKNIIHISLAVLISSNVAADNLQLYRDKMEYWQSRSVSAFKCTNRFEVAMFIYDASFEKGVHPSEVLAETIEKKTIENMDCVINSLAVLSPERRNRVINHYYKKPLFNKPEVFKQLLNSLKLTNHSSTTANLSFVS